MRDRIFLGVLSAAMAVGLVLFLIDPAPTQSPADEAALETIVEQSLESSSPSRFAVWHAAHEQITRLDPNRPAAAAAFVRSGLFHWYELSDADRHTVLTAVAPMLREEPFFNRMALPLFQLTGDFTILRRANPGTEAAMSTLASMAVTNGRFDDYRHFREQVRKRRLDIFETTKKGATPAELVAFVPAQPTTADDALLRGILGQLHVRPIDNNHIDSHRLDSLIDFALDHNLQPLDGLEAAIHLRDSANDPQRARLALHLGQFNRAADIESASGVADRARWHRYYVERAVAEMRRHQPLPALQYLQKADDGKSPDATAAFEEVQRIAGNGSEAAAIHATLAARANRVEQWTGKCGDDVCEHARGVMWSNGAPFTMKLLTVQSDDVPPYAEIYADETLTAEGAVSPSLSMRAALLSGVHRIDVRLANPTTRNAIRRRVRIE